MKLAAIVAVLLLAACARTAPTVNVQWCDAPDGGDYWVPCEDIPRDFDI